MKKIIAFTILLASLFSVQAQKTILSPSAAIVAKEIRAGKNAETYIHAFVTLAEGTVLEALGDYGVKVNSVVGSTLTVQIPSGTFNSLVASGLCSYIDFGGEVHPYLDKARTDLGIDYIHQGINLPQGYDGTGVVVGIVDNGFEYGHPLFYDTTGSTLRIKRVWQQFDSSGTPPAGFSYGSEYATEADILAAGTDYARSAHGTHVAGIAAGCGAPAGHGSLYRGIAPGADIVLVSVKSMTTSFDAIRYVHDYARSVGKPCVINMSYGTMTGPHDGTGSFDRMIEDYLRTNHKDSIVVVCAAGNSGNVRNHLYKHFSATDTIVRTLGGDLSTDKPFESEIDFWGNTGGQFSVSVYLYDDRNMPSNMPLIAETPFVRSDIDSVYNFQFNSIHNNIYDVTISVASTNPFNNRPSIFARICSDTPRYNDERFAFTVKSTNADVHVWSSVESFVSLSLNNFVDGDYDYTIGGAGGNTDAVISVGSYVTRPGKSDAFMGSNEEGVISKFSSNGPTLDGRVKPDICAPGESLYSGWNSYYGDLNDDTTVYNGQDYYYSRQSGTSQASPAVAGVIALWLQHNPSLNVDTVRTLLHTTALTDAYTGNIPASGSNRWGWGKINSFAALEPVVPMYYLRVKAPVTKGTVIGGGYHPQGNHTIEAVAVGHFIFTRWSDGNTDNPRVVNLTSDTVIVAEFGVPDCDTVSSFPWYAELDDATLQCWDIFHNSGVNDWVLLSVGTMLSTGFNTADNWLVSPHINVAQGTSLLFNCTSIATSIPDALAITAITANGDTVILADEQFTVINSGQRQVDLAPVAGQTIRIGFHHYACPAISALKLTDISIKATNGIEDIENSQVKIKVSDLTLTVDNPEGETVRLYDINGRQLVLSTGRSFTLPLPASGVYIIKVGNLPARKVVAVK